MTALAAGLAVLPALAAPVHDFTIRDVMDAPFPSDLVAAPTGARIAWVVNARGVRNVWIKGDGVGDAARPITRFAGDDGFDLGELAWDGASKAVVFTRGGTLGEGGELPVNPLSLLAGPPEQQVWAAFADGRAAVALGAGHLPRPSPVGGRVAFLLKGQVWLAPLDASAPARQVTHLRGDVIDLTWSPDGTRLAIVSHRTDHTLVGVLAPEGEAVTWMEPGIDDDQSPAWSPDGQRLAFVRVPSGADEETVEGRTAQPWSIWVGDAQIGMGRQVWAAANGRGSLFHPLLSDTQLLWGAGDQLVFPWERTGWLHLYSVPATGGSARELTTGGGFEVFNVASSPDRSTLVYSSNAADIDRWHVSMVPITTGTPRQLTFGTGIEDYPVLASNGQVFALASDARTPLHPVAIGDRRLADLVPGWLPASFPHDRLVEPVPVTFRAADGLPVHGQLFLPPASRRKPGPAILFFHGGPIRQMLPAWHPMNAYSSMYAMNQYLANEGYAVLSVNYRGGIGYGLDFRIPERFGRHGASEYNDILGAIDFLRARPDIDPRRIGSWGASYGGLMTALGLSRASNLLAAGVDYAGVHDLRADHPELSAVGARPGAAQLAYDSSAVATIGAWRSPVLVAAADDDRNVPFDQSVELVRELRRQGVDVEHYVLPDEIHDLLRDRSWLSLFERTDDFFARRLMTPAASGLAHQ
ncbi:MAG: prolyl oligopeptidase family serine peptidase [Sphingomonadales bacterium]|nr:prolyl oligopeptidase family serine peptidase [Sphingomonadales bacterium]MDE2170788.1 prolyl oligopeptidase family serine peptidase [Sphingomonadales bacterium]